MGMRVAFGLVMGMGMGIMTRDVCKRSNVFLAQQHAVTDEQWPEFTDVILL